MIQHCHLAFLPVHLPGGHYRPRPNVPVFVSNTKTLPIMLDRLPPPLFRPLYFLIQAYGARADVRADCIFPICHPSRVGPDCPHPHLSMRTSRTSQCISRCLGRPSTRPFHHPIPCTPIHARIAGSWYRQPLVAVCISRSTSGCCVACQSDWVMMAERVCICLVCA